MQRLLERGAARKLFEAAPVFRAGFYPRLFASLICARTESRSSLPFLLGANVFAPGAADLFFIFMNDTLLCSKACHPDRSDSSRSNFCRSG